MCDILHGRNRDVVLSRTLPLCETARRSPAALECISMSAKCTPEILSPPALDKETCTPIGLLNFRIQNDVGTVGLPRPGSAQFHPLI